MTAVHNSGRIDRQSAETGDPRRARIDLPELWTRGWRAVGSAGRGIRWYMSNLMGDSAYAPYVAHHRRHHPDVAPPTEREFWRQKMDDQDRNPGARCC